MQIALRLVFSKMRYVPLVDLAFSLEFLNLLGSDKKAMRFLKKLEEHIELTNPKLIKGLNQISLMNIMILFRANNLGSYEFFNKCAQLLEGEIQKDTWQKLDSNQIADLLSALRMVNV